MGQLGEEGGLVVELAQVEPEGVVVEAADHRDGQGAQAFLQLPQGAAAQALGLLRAQAEGGAGQTGDGLGAAADHAQGGLDADLPGGAELGGQGRGEALGLGEDVGLRAAEQAQGGEAFGEALGVAVEGEHGFQRGEGELVHPQGALEGGLLDAVDECLAAEDEPGLGAAEELVAAEGDDVGAVAQGFLHGGFLGQAPAGEVHQGAAAEVFQQGQAVGVGDAREVGGGDAGGEALDAVVAGVHAHEQAGAGADDGLVVLGVGAVGGAHLDELHAGAGHDVGDAEGAADLDQLAPADDPFLACAEAVEGEQHGGGVVVDHGDGFGAGQLADEPGDEVVAVATLAAGEVEFEVERVAGGQGDGFDGLLGQQGAAEVGVQHGAGEVEHPAHAAGMPGGEAFTGAAGEHGFAEFDGGELALAGGLAQFVEQVAQGFQQGLAAVALLQRRAGWAAQQAVDGG